MGNMCKAGDDVRPGPRYSKSELMLVEFEKELSLQNVSYDVFERCVKRFGYAVDLTDDCWRATVQET